MSPESEMQQLTAGLVAEMPAARLEVRRSESTRELSFRIYAELPPVTSNVSDREQVSGLSLDPEAIVVKLAQQMQQQAVDGFGIRRLIASAVADEAAKRIALADALDAERTRLRNEERELAANDPHDTERLRLLGQIDALGRVVAGLRAA